MIEPIRYCVSSGGPATSPAPPTQLSDPSLSTPATTDGSRPRPWMPLQTGLQVGRHSANASGGGHEQTRLRSPYAWSMRATGGQYLSGSWPAGNTPSSRA